MQPQKLLKWVTRPGVLLGATALVVLALSASPAAATQLGQNGRIAFSAGGDIYTTNPDGTGLDQLEFAGDDRQPAYSPDGHWLLFTSDASGNDDIWIIALNDDGTFAGEPIRRTFDPGPDHSPAFKPLGDPTTYPYAYVHENPSTGADIYLANAADSDGQSYVATGADELDPAWSHGGDTLAYVRVNPGGDGDIVTGTPRSGIELLTSGPDDDRKPSWYLGRIAFERTPERGNDTDIWQMKQDGNELVNLTNASGDDLAPAGSPNGKELAYVGQYQGQQRLLLATSDGTNAKPIPNVPAGATDPDWESIFELHITPLPQKATNIDVEAHGTFAIVSFDMKYPTPMPAVQLTDYDGNVQASTDLFTIGKHHEIKVVDLDPNRIYEIEILMTTPWGGKLVTQDAGELTTLQRNVTIWFEKVTVHEDTEASCGDFYFWFEASADGQTDLWPSLQDDETSICDGEVWDPDDIGLTLENIHSDTVSGYVLGVDDDSDCLSPLPGQCTDYLDSPSVLKEQGEWAEQTFVEDLGPKEYTVDGENWEKENTVWVHGGDDGELSFTWQYEVWVSYS